MEWRPRQPTHWNRYCTSILKQFLPRLELSEGRDTAEEHRQELQNLLGDMRVNKSPASGGRGRSSGEKRSANAPRSLADLWIPSASALLGDPAHHRGGPQHRGSQYSGAKCGVCSGCVCAPLP